MDGQTFKKSVEEWKDDYKSSGQECLERLASFDSDEDRPDEKTGHNESSESQEIEMYEGQL